MSVFQGREEGEEEDVEAVLHSRLM